MIIELIIYISITSFILSSTIGISLYSQKSLDENKTKIEESLEKDVLYDKGFISSSFIFITMGLIFIYISFVSQKAFDFQEYVYSKERKIQFDFNKDFNIFLLGIYQD